MGQKEAYLATLEGWLYFAVVADLFSRDIVGWADSETIDRHLVLNALSPMWLGPTSGSSAPCGGSGAGVGWFAPASSRSSG